MKKVLIIIVLIIGFIFVFVLSKVKAINYLPLLGKVIVIDPGHRGH